MAVFVPASGFFQLIYIQAIANGLGEDLGGKWLGQKGDAAGKIPGENLGAVAADINDLQRRLFALQPFAQIPAGHAAGHDQVRKQQTDLAAMLLPDFQGGGATGGFQQMITEL